MIKTIYSNKKKTKGQVILYSKNGKKVLGRYKFSTKIGLKSAKTKAKKREKQVGYFKYRK